MNPAALVVAGVTRLASAVLELVPEPDPEIRRLRVKHTQDMRRLRAEQHHERVMARIRRRRG